jgi:ribokinase
MGDSTATVVVVGSLNLDYIASVSRLPAPGQTIAASKLVRRFGGKGANQAIAAARQGARVRLIGCVGADADGTAYIGRLRKQGVMTDSVGCSTTELTGTALIAVDQRGENVIIVAAGANAALRPSSIANHQARIAEATAVLLQFETPIETTIAAIRCANRAKVPVMLNPSPYRRGFPWGHCAIDTLIVNAGEAQAIFGHSTYGPKQTATLSRALAKFRVAQLIITQGAKPTLCFSQGARFEVPTLRVKPIDTVGAGDAFAGTFAARRAQGWDLVSAISIANCAGALTTLKIGAQEAIPSRAATDRAARSLR